MCSFDIIFIIGSKWHSEVDLEFINIYVCTFLFSYLRGKKKEKYEKKKETRKIFLRPTGVLF